MTFRVSVIYFEELLDHRGQETEQGRFLRFTRVQEDFFHSWTFDTDFDPPTGNIAVTHLAHCCRAPAKGNLAHSSYALCSRVSIVTSGKKHDLTNMRCLQVSSVRGESTDRLPVSEGIFACFIIRSMYRSGTSCGLWYGPCLRTGTVHPT